MTLLQYSNFVCNTVNQIDTTSQTLCKEFAKMRYRMIWDAGNWKDAMGLVPSLIADTTGVMNVPTSIDRISGIRAAGNRMIFPADSAFVMQIDPSAFEATGDALAYEDFTDTADSNRRKIRLFPIPSANTSILIYGKRTFVPLNLDEDEPILRNIDNALISFTTGDMLRRQRQYDKAATMMAEGTAFLDGMGKIEKQAAGYVQRVVPVVESDSYNDYNDCEFMDKGTFSSLAQGGDVITPITVSLVIGQDYIDVPFPQVQTSVNWLFKDLHIETTDNPVIEVIGVRTISNRATSGFRAWLDAAPTTANQSLVCAISPP